MDVFEAIKTRRSVRRMKEKPVPREVLDKVIAAGRMAPSGGNSQTAHFIVIENRQILDALAVMVRDAFANMETTPDMYRSLKSAVTASKRGNYVFHYNAPVLIVVANQKDYGNAMADSAVAVENMMLAANALDLGSCYINQLHWLADDPQIRAAMLDLGMTADETVCASMILGYPDTKDGLPNRAPGKITGNPVTFVK